MQDVRQVFFEHTVVLAQLVDVVVHVLIRAHVRDQVDFKVLDHLAKWFLHGHADDLSFELLAFLVFNPRLIKCLAEDLEKNLDVVTEDWKHPVPVIFLLIIGLFFVFIRFACYVQFYGTQVLLVVFAKVFDHVLLNEVEVAVQLLLCVSLSSCRLLFGLAV